MRNDIEQGGAGLFHKENLIAEDHVASGELLYFVADEPLFLLIDFNQRTGRSVYFKL